MNAKRPKFRKLATTTKNETLETILNHLSLIPFLKFITQTIDIFSDVSQFIEYLVCLSANFMTQFFNLKNI